MSTRNITAIAAAVLTFGSVATASAQTAAASPAPSPRLTFAGLLDFYYQYEFNNPQGGVSAPPVYNERNDSPTLTLAQLDASYAAPANGGFGAHVTLVNGDTTTLDHVQSSVSGGPSEESRWNDLFQLYGTLINKTGYGVDFGEFYTPFGYEATNDSNLNPNYSFSDVYFDLLPTYNTGLRFYTPTLWGAWVFKAYVVNALNDTAAEGVHDDNNQKGIFGVASYTDPKGKWTGTENWGFSHDNNVEFGSLNSQDSPQIDNTDDTMLSDTDLTITPTAKWTIGAEYVYRSDSATEYDYSLDDAVTGFVPSVTDVTQTDVTDNQISHGYAGYLVYDTTPLDDIAFRYSSVKNTAIGNPYDETVTYALKSADGKWLTKFEYRYDHSSEGVDFEDSSGNFTKTSDNTVTVGEVYTF